MSDLRQKSVRGAAWSAIENWASQGISFLVFLVLARLLGPADFGLVALAAVYVLIVQLIIRQGFAEAIVQVRELEPAHLDSAFWANLALSLVLGAGTLAGAPLIAAALGNPQLVPIIRWLSLLFPLGALSAVQQAVLNRRMEFRALAVRTFLAFGCSGATGIAMALLGWGVWSLVAQQLVYAAVNVVVLWSTSGWHPRLEFSRPHLRQLWRFGVHVFGVNLLDVVNKRADQYIVGLQLGAVALGFYAIAGRVHQLMLALGVTPLYRVAAGAFSRLQDEPEKLAAALLRGIEISSAVAFPAFLGFAAVAPEIVTICFGSKWLPAVPAMQLLMVLGALQSVQFFHGQVLRAMGRPGWDLALIGLQTALNLTVLLAVSRYGLLPMIAASVARAYLLAPLELLVIRKLIPLRLGEYAARTLPQACLSLAMLGAVLLLKRAAGPQLPPLALLVASIIAGAGIYAAGLALVRPALWREVSAVAALLRSRKSAPAVPTAT